MKKTWPILYKKTSTGADQMWEIRVDGNKIITRYGQVDGKIQETPPTVCEGKNIGRANATTPEEQAMLEAESQWTKKLKKDYVKTLDAARAGESSELIGGGILPMLAKKFSEDGDKIVWPAFVQPKLDGHRCIAMVDSTGKCTLWSRTRKPIPSMPHIVAAVEALKLKGGHVLDGELYNHAYHAKFEELTHFIRSSEPAPGHEVLQYHIYDTASPKDTFTQRNLFLKQILKDADKNVLVNVETISVEDEDDMMIAFEHFLSIGYEGAILRNAAGLYVNKRSVDLQKVKKFDDDEFEVLDVKEGKGKMAGRAVFICRVKGDITVDAKMKGKLEDLKKYWDNPKLAIGRQLTIQYQGFTKSGKPRFPVALRFREDA